MNPFATSEKSIQLIGESALITKIRSWLGPVSPPTPYGIGDDCALIQPSTGVEVITCDSLSYGVHFDASLDAADAGSKLIKRNLSDLAAMGALPKCAVLALLAGPNLSLDWLESFFSGIRTSCTHYKLALIGGDLSAIAYNQFSAVLTLIGEGQQLCTRSQAADSDFIYVTGSLGGSQIQKHWNFEPRLREGRWLATYSDCSALMDLSDGLGKDLAALLPANCQAAIDLLVFPSLRTLIESLNLPQILPLNMLLWMVKITNFFLPSSRTKQLRLNMTGSSISRQSRSAVLVRFGDRNAPPSMWTLARVQTSCEWMASNISSIDHDSAQRLRSRRHE